MFLCLVIAFALDVQPEQQPLERKIHSNQQKNILKLLHEYDR